MDIMEPMPRCNTLASSVQIRQTSLFQSLSSFLDHAQVESFIRATKTGAKRSKVFIAVLLIIRNKDVLNCALYQVKQIDHGKIRFQVKTKYDLAKLRLVNGVSEDEEETELELVFEKGSNLMSPLTVKWSAESGRAKKNFLVSLWKLVNEHMTATPQFLNINYNMLQSHLSKASEPKIDSLSLSKTLKQVSLLGSPALEMKEYKYLTGEEEQDLGVVTDGIDWAVENAEDFMEKLMNELSGLTKANIHSIMAVENDVIRLFNIMDHALHELCRLEDIMVRYEDELNEDLIRMEETLQSYQKQQIRNDNTRKLHDLLTELLDQITFSETTSDILLSMPLKTASQISRVTEAVLLIRDKRKKCNASPLIHMVCVAEQRDKMDALLQAFSERVIEAVAGITSPAWNAAQSIRHSKLAPLLPVVNWLSTFAKPKYDDLVAQYQVTAQTAYQKVLREFFEDKRSTVTRKSTEKILSKFGSRKSELALSQKLMGSNNRLQSQSSLHSGNSTTSLDSIASCRSESDFTVTHGSQFEASFRDSLDFIEITMSKEEGFINNFFKRPGAGKIELIWERLFCAGL
ncbi:exocyst complex component 1-like isoform X1 [Bolinopsis microptera]|uniref:exocyst complex component 1-like isoform X1 n=1 Tax=Bolinopsis microptera TaxID=2820187 RepID=UPI00307968E8